MTSGTVVEAGETLSKLAKAAKSKEPKPLPVREEESAEAAEAGAVDSPVGLVAPESSPEASTPDIVAPPPSMEGSPADTGVSDAPVGSNVQARSMRRKEPPLASTSKAKDARNRPVSGSDKLSDLLLKQKQLQRQLKLGLFSTDEGDTILDFESPSSASEKAV